MGLQLGELISGEVSNGRRNISPNQTRNDVKTLTSNIVEKDEDHSE